MYVCTYFEVAARFQRSPSPCCSCSRFCLGPVNTWANLMEFPAFNCLSTYPPWGCLQSWPKSPWNAIPKLSNVPEDAVQHLQPSIDSLHGPNRDAARRWIRLKLGPLLSHCWHARPRVGRSIFSRSLLLPSYSILGPLKAYLVNFNAVFIRRSQVGFCPSRVPRDGSVVAGDQV